MAPITEDRIAALRAFTEELQRGIAQAEQDVTARRALVEMMDVHVQLYREGDELWLKLTSDLGAGVKRFVLMSLRTPRQPEIWGTVLQYHTKIAHPTRQAGTKEIYDDVLRHAIINRRVI